MKNYTCSVQSTESYKWNTADRSFVVRMLLILPVVAVLLLLWCDAASAAEPTSKATANAAREAETVTVCTRRPMLQGKVNEMVTVCETIAYTHAEPTFHATPKAHYGARVNGHKVVFARLNGKAVKGYWTIG
jgi:hypothetical protein